MKCLIATLIALVACAVGGAQAAGLGRRPNVLVIYSDDHGWADLGIQGTDPDVRTPHIDQLARDGVRFTRGYVSAPQCVPSRAGLITGRYQQRFGVEDNNHGPLPLTEVTIAERLAPAGYTSGWVGKCHLDIGGAKGQSKAAAKGRSQRLLADHMPHHQGFKEYFRGELRDYHASHALDGTPFADAPRLVHDTRFRVEVQTEAALSFLERRSAAVDEPWFLYLAWYAPHVPLESPEPWFGRTPESLPLERRQALAMIAAMDDGLGRIREKLRDMGVEKDTLIFFIGDNGAPLGRAWNGSTNAPLAGQKGMLSEGGIRTPFVAAWPGRWPAGTTYDRPVINLDVAATAAAAAGLPPDPAVDGVDLTPFVTGTRSSPPHERLFWRWGSQAAVLEMPYKLIRLGNHKPLLFDVTSPEGERDDSDLAAARSEIVARLDARLKTWAHGLQPPGLVDDPSAFGRHHEEMFVTHRLMPASHVAGDAKPQQPDPLWTSLQPPAHLGPPTPAHAESNRAFQGIPSLAVSAGGRLWATWYAGVTPGEDENNYVVLASSGDDGAHWNEVATIDPDGRGSARAFDPELWVAPDGRLFWFWAQMDRARRDTELGVWCVETREPDAAEPTWSGPRRIGDGVMMCKPIVVGPGDWILPISRWREHDRSAECVVSSDAGASWAVRGACNVPNDVRQYDEHMIVERKDDSLWMLVRTTYGIGESVSQDCGATWPDLRPSKIAHPAARFFIRRMASGGLLLVKHGPLDVQTGRSHLTAYVSTDDGRTWGGGLLLDERSGVSYPDGQETPDGLIRIVYDRNRITDREILMATFREDDAAAGKDVTAAVKLRQRVSKATGGRDIRPPERPDARLRNDASQASSNATLQRISSDRQTLHAVPGPTRR